MTRFMVKPPRNQHQETSTVGEKEVGEIVLVVLIVTFGAV